MKVTKVFKGVRNGEIYPVEFRPGDECPAELLGAAIHFGAVEMDAKGETKQTPKAKTK